MRSFVFAAIGILVLLSVPQQGTAAVLGDEAAFFVDSGRDHRGRSSIAATLQYVGENAYFFVDNTWWNSLAAVERERARGALEVLSAEFSDTIYPTLRSEFGSEPRPGIDGDTRLTVLFHGMSGNDGGYVRSEDGYSTLQLPRSNEREMVYLNTDYVHGNLVSSFLAHEFMHWITFEQKKGAAGRTEEEVWLNEARADYASWLLGYDEQLGTNSLLAHRKAAFLRQPTVSLVEWDGRDADYGAAALFAHYLADRYSPDILVDSLHSSLVGIPSLEAALAEQGAQESFSEVFGDWLVAVLLNNCEAGPAYCYTNSMLDDVRITPQVNFLPSGTESVLEATRTTNSWAGNWQRIRGGGQALELEFRATEGEFYVPYVLQNKQGAYEIGTIDTDENGEGVLLVEDFQEQYQSFVFLPVLSGSDSVLFSYTASSFEGTPQTEEEQRAQLLAQLAELRQTAESLRVQLASIRSGTANNAGQASCTVSRQLTVGAQGEEVRCLQRVLNRSQETRLASEGAGSPGNETAYFGPLTADAVIRFQELYAAEILEPLGLTSGTGYVGTSTRAKLNELL